MRRQVTLVKLHAFNPSDFGFERAAFFDSDDTVAPNALESFGQLRANFGIAVCGDSSHLFDFVIAAHLCRFLGEELNDSIYCRIHAALKIDRVRARSYVA